MPEGHVMLYVGWEPEARRSPMSDEEADRGGVAAGAPLGPCPSLSARTLATPSWTPALLRSVASASHAAGGGGAPGNLESDRAALG